METSKISYSTECETKYSIRRIEVEEGTFWEIKSDFVHAIARDIFTVHAIYHQKLADYYRKLKSEGI